ncbi:MAG: biotin--[acetyl-CoA-carboxylase] ligase [Spirochaetia bacterium]
MGKYCINNPFEGDIYHFEVVSSTMDEASKNLQHGAVFIADHQSAGRGRLPQRIWQDEKGKNLLCTLVLEQKKIDDLPISLLVGLAIMDMLEDFSIFSRIKWPNDVMVQDAKISGILVQQQHAYFLIGIGININQIQPQVDEKRVISMCDVLGQQINIAQVLENLLSQFFSRIQCSQTWNHDINSKLWGKNQTHTYSLDLAKKYTVQGQVQYVDTDGALLLMTENGPQKIYAGECFI